ncbi:hypothetical protein DAPPUDRAFT_97016 [Daphnia pulex]|uniref:Uncharacterized protein n=1 Tax=Daphnia pulex TaxID=6669 RepID=E9G0B3_DAPPU|nr:hypothetical protein DAPPUDRAFT_97016 [Daphnia pulex]|eukprot:EFX86876.1 hypothetical protein DAPPUDRAFT_97016 [Daphnia pulex]
MFSMAPSALIKHRLNRIVEMMGWGKIKDDPKKPVQTGKTSDEINPSPSHQVSTPEPEPMEDKTIAREDSAKEGSREKPRKQFRFSMKSAKLPVVHGESSCVKLLQFRKFTENEIGDEMETPEMEDLPSEFEDEKKSNRWSKRKSYNLNTPAVKTPAEKSSKVVLYKFCRLSENAMENTTVQIHKEEEAKSTTVTEFLTQTGFLLEKPQKKPGKLQPKKESYFSIKSLPCNQNLIHHRNERRHLKYGKGFQKECQCIFCDSTSPLSPKCPECRLLHVPESSKTEKPTQIPFVCKCKWCQTKASVCSMCGRLIKKTETKESTKMQDKVTKPLVQPEVVEGRLQEGTEEQSH